MTMIDISSLPTLATALSGVLANISGHKPPTALGAIRVNRIKMIIRMVMVAILMVAACSVLLFPNSVRNCCHE